MPPLAATFGASAWWLQPTGAPAHRRERPALLLRRELTVPVPAIRMQAKALTQSVQPGPPANFFGRAEPFSVKQSGARNGLGCLAVVSTSWRARLQNGRAVGQPVGGGASSQCRREGWQAKPRDRDSAELRALARLSRDCKAAGGDRQCRARERTRRGPGELFDRVKQERPACG